MLAASGFPKCSQAGQLADSKLRERTERTELGGPEGLRELAPPECEERAPVCQQYWEIKLLASTGSLLSQKESTPGSGLKGRKSTNKGGSVERKGLTRKQRSGTVSQTGKSCTKQVQETSPGPRGGAFQSYRQVLGVLVNSMDGVLTYIHKNDVYKHIYEWSIYKTTIDFIIFFC